ncbi:hypothetical protein [Gracilimonas mengyeensis]|uniref:Uncharacterized protein n=1 Tax=Gracilimonas mengyeensis TaxID=1302730 RepID=A0A521D7X2_9BACT|nr:hypothetical protein [Gracilimonas mengyeensis]SMO67181.1 hypothetical protein SAMN06265219_107151 [Gracilimonas mengyeensis]
MHTLLHDPRVELPIRLLILAIIILGLNYCNMTTSVNEESISSFTSSQTTLTIESPVETNFGP